MEEEEEVEEGGGLTQYMIQGSSRHTGLKLAHQFCHQVGMGARHLTSAPPERRETHQQWCT